MTTSIREYMVQIDLGGPIWPYLSVIAIPLFIYFIKLELRVRKVEELETKLSLESRLNKLESDPVFNALKNIDVDDAIDLYNKERGSKNESK